MTTQHTPGPWKAQGSRIVQAGKMEAWQLIIASLPTTIDPRPTPDAAAKEYATRDANARLIAAAPEMLHALKLAAEELNKMGCECDCEASPVCCPVCAVNDAIAKALTEP